jgi:CBS domain-containing membrane protein
VRTTGNSTLYVRDLMTEQVIAVVPEDSLTTLRDLMYERHIRHMPVVDRDRELVGLVSQRDLLRNALIEQQDVPIFVEDVLLQHLLVGDMMNTGVEAIEPDTEIGEAARIMFENKYGCLPVVEGRRLVGILTEADFVRLFAIGS